MCGVELTAHPFQLKTDFDKLIFKSANEQSGQTILQFIIGEFKPGYIYRAVNIHKTNNPSQPIISRNPTPIYGTTKILNHFISPYLTASFENTSSDDFLQNLGSCRSNGGHASVEMTSLFTKVSRTDLIGKICQNVYHHLTTLSNHLTKSLSVSCYSP